MYWISNDLSPFFVIDIMTKICVSGRTWSTSEFEKEEKYNYSKKSNYKLSTFQERSKIDATLMDWMLDWAPP